MIKPRNIPDSPREKQWSFRYQDVLLVIVLTVSLMWPAFINRGPFFFFDSTGYIHDGDVAAAKMFGRHVATGWSDVFRKTAPAARPSPPQGRAASVGPAPASAGDQDVMAGRSVYYGLFADLAGRLGAFWPLIALQALCAAAVIVIALAAASLRLHSKLAVSAVLVAATPLPIFVCLVMPDIWIGLGLAAAATLLAFGWGLGWVSRTVLFIVMAGAALSHSSAPVELILLAVVMAAIWSFARFAGRRGRRATRHSGSVAPPTVVARLSRWGLVGCVAAACIGLLGAKLFERAVTAQTGHPPISPPFLTARVIADGPGARFVQSRCGQMSFEVCRYQARLPVDSQTFLWDTDPHRGIFGEADGPVRRRLSEEDAIFAEHVVLAYPVEQTAASMRNGIEQLFSFGVDLINYSRAEQLYFRRTMPRDAFDQAAPSLSFASGWPTGLMNGVYAAALVASLATFAAVRWGGPRSLGATDMLFVGALLALLINAGVSGAFSGVFERYQARVCWIVVLAAAAAAAPRLAAFRAALGNRLEPRSAGE